MRQTSPNTTETDTQEMLMVLQLEVVEGGESSAALNTDGFTSS